MFKVEASFEYAKMASFLFGFEPYLASASTYEPLYKFNLAFLSVFFSFKYLPY